jgi:transcriptional regulator with XRE-family HTH domain
MKLALLVKAYRKANKISLRKMAREIGIETTALYRFEAGRSLSNDKWTAILVWTLEAI